MIYSFDKEDASIYESLFKTFYQAFVFNIMLQMSQFEYFPVTFNKFMFSVYKFPILHLSLCLRGVSVGVAENKIKVILNDVHYFIQLLHLPKEKKRNNITYCVWLLVFLEFLIFEVSLCNILFVMRMVLVQFDVWEVVLMESALEVDLASSSMLEQQYELACSL